MLILLSFTGILALKNNIYTFLFFFPEKQLLEQYFRAWSVVLFLVLIGVLGFVDFLGLGFFFLCVLFLYLLLIW